MVRWVAFAASLALASNVHAVPPRKTSHPAPRSFAPFSSQADIKDAMANVWDCVHKDDKGGFHVDVQKLTCDDTWHGVHWTLNENWNGDFEGPAGKWHFACKHDPIEDDSTCTLATNTDGGLFLVAYGQGYDVAVEFGQRKFPGEEQIVRVDEKPLVATTAEYFSRDQEQTIFRQMIAGKLLRYRWYDWPYKAMQNGSVDVSDFRWQAALINVMLMTLDQDVIQRPTRYNRSGSRLL